MEWDDERHYSRHRSWSAPGTDQLVAVTERGPEEGLYFLSGVGRADRQCCFAGLQLFCNWRVGGNWNAFFSVPILVISLLLLLFLRSFKRQT